MIDLEPDIEELTLRYSSFGAEAEALYRAYSGGLRAPFLFRLDGFETGEAYPIEDQRPGHRIELGPAGYPGGLAPPGRYSVSFTDWKDTTLKPHIEILPATAGGDE